MDVSSEQKIGREGRRHHAACAQLSEAFVDKINQGEGERVEKYRRRHNDAADHHWLARGYVGNELARNIKTDKQSGH